MGDYRMCLFFVRKFKSTKAGPPQDIRDLFKKYAKGGDRMTAEQLGSFLVEIQGATDGDGFSVAELEKVVEQVLEKTRPGSDLTERTTLTLTLDDFHHYLFSADLNPPTRDQVYQDMTKPLSHYFIYTGHNSYLTGNQLSSTCSDLPIIEALERGVRVIELDLWPNNNKDDVHVVHGRTLTTPVKLDRCLESIRKHAFVSSPYPVIVTLEDHLTPDLQAKVAEVISKIFGGMLYCPEQPLDEFPSPEDLKYKILISTKPPKKHHTAGNAKSTENTPRKCFPSIIIKVRSSDDDSWGKVSPPSDLTDNQEDEAMSDTYTSEDSDDESSPTTSGVLAYESLIAIHAGKPKGGLKEALQVELNKVRRLSLSEQRLEKATKDHKMDVIRFTQKNVLRVYPRGTRFNSSNYKPLIAWMHGAQMVAFNMQGYGRALWLMHGMFRSNGGCGYVQKPDFLMSMCTKHELFRPDAKLPVKKTLKVKVYMGDGWESDFKSTDFDSYSPPDFYTRVGIAGVPQDSVMKRTRVKKDKWTPVWDTSFTFPLRVPELALLRVEVHEYDIEQDDFGGQTCLPVPALELRPGIRAVPLFDKKGKKYDSVRLLMRFEFV